MSFRLLLLAFCVLSTGCAVLFDDTGPAPIYTYGVGKGVGSTGSHMVTAGDSLTNVAKRYGLAVSDLAAQNGMTVTSQLKIGQRLTLPRPRSYQVKTGDTARTVANMFDMSQADIAQLNRLDGPYMLHAGQTLNLSRVRLNQLVQVAASKPLPVPEKPKSAQSVVPKGGAFISPVRGRIISAYGVGADGRQNDGVNIAAAAGETVRAAQAGQVVYAAGDIDGYGNMVLIKHDKSYITVYAHLARIDVAKGDHVDQGQGIGIVGQTGAVTTPQLHFEIRKGKATENPIKHVSFVP